MDFGFTNERSRLERVAAWRDAAVADGWGIEPTYGSEDVSRASRLKHSEGFVCQILTREHGPSDGGKWKFTANVSVWGPDGLALNPGDTYDMGSLRAGTTTCAYCGKTDAPTKRVGFAGRACHECAPTEEAKLGPGYYR